MILWDSFCAPINDISTKTWLCTYFAVQFTYVITAKPTMNMLFLLEHASKNVMKETFTAWKSTFQVLKGCPEILVFSDIHLSKLNEGIQQIHWFQGKKKKRKFNSAKIKKPNKSVKTSNYHSSKNYMWNRTKIRIDSCSCSVR